MSYPNSLKERARQLAEAQDLSAEQIAVIFSKEAIDGEHDYQPTPRTIRTWLSKTKPIQKVLTPEQLNEVERHDKEIF